MMEMKKFKWVAMKGVDDNGNKTKNTIGWSIEYKTSETETYFGGCELAGEDLFGNKMWDASLTKETCVGGKKTYTCISLGDCIQTYTTANQAKEKMERALQNELIKQWAVAQKGA